MSSRGGTCAAVSSPCAPPAAWPRPSSSSACDDQGSRRVSESLVGYESSDNVGLLRLNDPATLNACSDEMGELLIERLTQAQREARAIVLTGVGRGFSSGANLAASAVDKPAAERDAGARLEGLFNPLMALIRGRAVPFWTAVNGAAAGAGCCIGLSGDLVVAAQ